MAGYSKLWTTIVTSSVWSEDDKTRIMWITMLAVTEADGHVSGSIPGMAAVARLSITDTQIAIDRLCAPDPYSRSLEFEGRRITESPGGWQILNYDKYRASRDEDERKAYMRDYMKKYRKQNSKLCKPTVNPRKPPLAQAEAEAEAEAIKEKDFVDKSTELESEFEKARTVYPGTKLGPGPEYENFLKVCKKKKLKEAEVIQLLIPAIKKQIAWRESANGEFRPEWKGFSAWINQMFWTAEFPDNPKDMSLPKNLNLAERDEKGKRLSELNEDKLTLEERDFLYAYNGRMMMKEEIGEVGYEKYRAKTDRERGLLND